MSLLPKPLGKDSQKGAAENLFPEPRRGDPSGWALGLEPENLHAGLGSVQRRCAARELVTFPGFPGPHL